MYKEKWAYHKGCHMLGPPRQKPKDSQRLDPGTPKYEELLIKQILIEGREKQGQ
jgi:hypothetical protein